MTEGNLGREQHLPAGAFSSWLTGVQDAIRQRRGSLVPCNGCTACCTSSQFIPIAPEETDTLSHIPADLLFPAPRRPPGHVVLGYDERGHCPMLLDNRCSIYEHRPNACRTYDCRVLTAAGVDGGSDPVARQARRWQFDLPTPADGNEQLAVRTAARFLAEHPEIVPEGAAPHNGAELAVLAIAVHDLFLDAAAATAEPAVTLPKPQDVGAAIRQRMEPSAGT